MTQMKMNYSALYETHFMLSYLKSFFPYASEVSNWVMNWSKRSNVLQPPMVSQVGKSFYEVAFESWLLSLIFTVFPKYLDLQFLHYHVDCWTHVMWNLHMMLIQIQSYRTNFNATSLQLKYWINEKFFSVAWY